MLLKRPGQAPPHPPGRPRQHRRRHDGGREGPVASGHVAHEPMHFARHQPRQGPVGADLQVRRELRIVAFPCVKESILDAERQRPREPAVVLQGMGLRVQRDAAKHHDHDGQQHETKGGELPPCQRPRNERRRGGRERGRGEPGAAHALVREVGNLPADRQEPPRTRPDERDARPQSLRTRRERAVVEAPGNRPAGERQQRTRQERTVQHRHGRVAERSRSEMRRPRDHLQRGAAESQELAP